MSAAELHAALAEIIRRGQAIINGTRLVGGPRAVAFDLTSVASRALGVELGGADVAQKTWQPPEERVQRRRGRVAR
jgi:hypothetical protein